jgi:hypothetical protein
MLLLFVRKGHNTYLALMCLLVWLVTAYGTESRGFVSRRRRISVFHYRMQTLLACAACCPLVTGGRDHAHAASVEVRKPWNCASSPSVFTFNTQCFGRNGNGLCCLTQSSFLSGWDEYARGPTVGKQGFGFVNSNICTPQREM